MPSPQISGKTDSGGHSAASGPFPRTRWSLVYNLRTGSDTEKQAAKEALSAMYWRPVFKCFRSLCCSDQDAEDLTQEFFVEHVVENETLANAKKELGRLRCFVSVLLRRRWQDWIRRVNAGKRGDGAQSVDVMEVDGEALVPFPEVIFDRESAKALLDQVERELRRRYGEDRFNAFWPYRAGGLSEAEGHRIANALKMEEPAVKVAVSRFKKSFRECLRSSVAETVPPGELEAELKDLCKFLAYSSE